MTDNMTDNMTATKADSITDTIAAKTDDAIATMVETVVEKAPLNLKQEEAAWLSDHLDALLNGGLNLLLASLILVIGWSIGQWISNRIRKSRRLDATLASFLSGLARYAIMGVSIVMMLSEFGVQTASLLAVLGAAGLAIGLALQGTLSNVAAGVMLLILRPFKLGDYITVGSGGVGGTVKTLGLFGTELAAADNVYIFVPNGQIWGNNITNYSRNGARRQDILIGISYDDDINHAITVIQDILAQDHRILQTDDKQPQVVTDKLADFSVNLIVRFWSANADYWNLRWDMTKAIKNGLDQAGITIPYPVQTHLDMKELQAQRQKA